MATIYSNRNDLVGTHSTVYPNVTTTWAGSIVPSATDLVYIVGRRATINQGAFSKWASTRTITVNSTANFATTGFFYTVTDRGQIVKIDYTGITSTTFTGCSIDESDPFYVWDDGGNIPNGSYVHNPAYIVTINSGETFECDELIIQEGGWLLINGGTLKVNKGVVLRDGRLVGRGAGKIIISRDSNGLSSSYIGYLTTENYPISVLDIDGGETRTYSTLLSSASKGDVSVLVSDVINGNFQIGDEVSIYQENDYRRRDKGYTGYRDASASFKNMDEGFDVCGVSGNNIYLALRNGSKGTVKDVQTIGDQKAIDVEVDHTNFNVGDKIVINNVGYTIDKIEDSEFTLKEYDFTNTSTDLSDFWINDPTHIYSENWVIEQGVGLRNTTSSYSELVNKYIWKRDVIVEAEMSPLSAYTSGTRGTGKFGIFTSYDPAYRWGHRGDDAFKSDYLQVSDGSDYIAFYIRSMSNYASNRLSRDIELRDITRKNCKYRVDNRKGKTTVYVNGSELTTEFRRDGNFKGLVGIYCQDSNFRCKSMTIKVPTQRIYITTTNTINVNQRVYRSGIEWDHPVGSKILKIASINLGTGNHQDLAFAYRGQNGSGEFPLITQVNGASVKNNSIPYVHNHDFNVDYYYDLGNSTSAKSMTIDLGSEKTFSHVSFVPRMVDYSTYYGMNGVAIYGSNDLTTWDTLYGPTDDTKKFQYNTYNRMAFYPTGTATYRYVKFETKGAQHATYKTNRYVNIGVHDFSSGYKLSVNNASDFNVGDKITVMSDSGYSMGSKEIEAYYAWVSNNASDPEEFWHGGWLPECTIIAKEGNVLSLNKPIWWGYIEDADSVTVVKTSRNFTITGTMGPTNSSNDWRWPNITLNGGSNLGRIYLFKNTLLSYIGSYRYSSSTSFNRGFRNYSYDYWNAVLMDGCVHMMGPDSTTWAGVGHYASHGISRNSLVAGMYTGYWLYANTASTGVALFNNKILNTSNGVYVELMENFVANYNEVANCDNGMSFYAFRVDRMVNPHNNEIRRNYIKGTSNSGFRVGDETVGPKRVPRIKIESNMVRATDDYAISGRSFSGSPYVDSNFMAEHTGSRISRYRNEGFISQGDTSSDLSYMQTQKDFGRYGYDLTFGVYNIYERNYKQPDILRVYNTYGDDYFAMLGMELDVWENVPFQVYVQFDYRYPHMARLQDDGNQDGRLILNAIQHGTIIDTQYGIVPSTAGVGWNTFSGTFTFAPEEGKSAIYLTRDAQNSYIEIRNSNAYVMTDSYEAIKVIGNTFKISEVWDQYREMRDLRPLTSAGVQAIKINNLKL